jgi:surfactin synthase thioesterase subunit
VSEVLTGYEHAGRPELDGAQNALGMFLNTVPLRIRLVDGSWAELVREVHAAEVALLPRRRYPMARMKQDAGARAPLFESVFNFTHFYPLRQLREEFSLVDVRAWAETEFVLRAEFSRHFFTDDVCLYLQYHSNVFDEARIVAVGECYRAALESMTADPHAHRTPAAPHPRNAGVPVLNDCNLGRPHAGGFGSAGGDSHTAHRNVGVPVLNGCNVGRQHAGGDGDDGGADGGAADPAVVRRIAAAWSEVLGVPAERIGAADDFFALGGHSLSALRAVVKLGGLVTLTDLTAYPTLGALAAVAAAGNRRERGLLRHLSPDTPGPNSAEASRTGSSDTRTSTNGTRASGARANGARASSAGGSDAGSSADTSSAGERTRTSGAATLVCLPYAAGNAVNFRPLAAELVARCDATVLAVELPGHDPGVDEPFLGVHETARAVVDELAERGHGPLVLWGHCGGASVAVEAARLLLAQGRDLRHLVIGSKLLPTESEMREAIDEVARSTDAEVLAWMVRESGFTELDGLDPANAGTIARAFRHDVDGGHRYFLRACAEPFRLDVPITFVAAADDPLMGDYRRLHRRWSLLTGDLRLRELDAGGHYFVRARAAFAAELVAEIFRSQKG